MENLDLNVIKRSGDKAPFDFTKIYLVIDHACYGQNVDSQLLKDKLGAFLVNNISTSIIQEQLVSLALSLTTPEDTEWRFVASKLLRLNLFKKTRDAQNNDGYGYGNFVDFVYKAVDDGVYHKKITEVYSESELQEFATYINPNYDYNYDYGGMEMLCSRYLFKHKGMPYELPQQRYACIALLAASVEKRFNRLHYARKFYELIASKKVSPATPIMLNLGKPNGNLASCFILAMNDSLKSIYYALNQAAEISKNAGGVGVNCSRVRGHNASIRGVPNASGGVNPWVRLFNDTSVAVNQLGSRKGAITCALDVWHIDIEEFLELQTENGDARVKSFDIFPQIVVNDVYEAACKSDGDWYLFDPHEIRQTYGVEIAELWGDTFASFYEMLCMHANEGKIKMFKRIKAKDLRRETLMVDVETGLPYWMHKDNTNRANPNKHAGMIGSANLCVESFSNFAPSEPLEQYFIEKDGEVIATNNVKPGYVHTCNLVSPNASQIEFDEIEEVATMCVRFLDNLLELAKPPIVESQMHNDDYRILGIGSLGLADAFAKNGIVYGEQESLDYARAYFERFAYFGIKASSDLAIERGSYKYFEGSDWQKGIFFGRKVGSAEWEKFCSPANGDLNWGLLAGIVHRQGMRNGGLFAIAPNTSTAILIGCSSSVLPIYGKFYTEVNGLITTPYVAQFLSDETYWVYRENKNVNQFKVVDVMAEIQRWTDQGISFEPIINFDHSNIANDSYENVRAKDISDMYAYAFDQGLKTVYYLRGKTKKQGCTSCAN